jgi:hypothetical protein
VNPIHFGDARLDPAEIEALYVLALLPQITHRPAVLLMPFEKA